MKIQTCFKTSVFVALSIFVTTVQAQDSTRKTRSVEVTSTFKPVLKEAAKINFNATPPTADSTRPRLQYELPAQNLLFAYVPGTLKPLALTVDTGGKWDNYSYAKLGYGGLKTPYFETGLSLGNGNTAGVNIYGKHISSKGKIRFQNFSDTKVELNGFLKTSKNLEWNARVGGQEEKYNKYGFEPKSSIFLDDSLRVKFQTVSTRLSLRNLNRTEYGLSYAPELKLDAFTDRLNNRETAVYLNLPLQKSVGENFIVHVGLTGNLTRYTQKTKGALTSNYLEFSPSLLVKKAAFSLQAGLKPAWDNGEFKLFPNVTGEFSLAEKGFTIQAGWIGYLRNVSYKSVATYNPWIWAPGKPVNSRVEEIYGGIKGSVTDHFSYSVRAGFNKFTNHPLFVNDTGTGKSFQVIYEPTLNAINVSGEFGYAVGEKFSVHTGLVLNKYTSLDEASKPWGLLPLEFKTNVRLQLLKDLFAKGDLYIFDAPWYRTKSGSGKQKGAADLSAGLEFGIVKHVKLWVQFNNILNSDYQRWRQYPVYGFNFLGGVVFSFAQNNK